MTESNHPPVVAITGSSSGLGAQLAQVYSSHHYAVVLIARRKEQLQQVADLCLQKGAAAVKIIVADLSQADQRPAVATKIWQQFGRVDVFINNAGFGIMQPAVAFSAQQEHALLSLNLAAVIELSRLLAQKMQAQKIAGHIVNIASMAGKVATIKASVYAATKAGVLAYSDSLRLELKPHNIHVMTVNLGPMATPFFDDSAASRAYLNAVRPFVVDEHVVARRVFAAVAANKREVNLPRSLQIASIFSKLMPHLSDYLNGGLFNKK